MEICEYIAVGFSLTVGNETIAVYRSLKMYTNSLI